MFNQVFPQALTNASGPPSPAPLQDFWLLDHTLPGNLFRLMPPDAQQRLFGNIARHLTGMSRETQLQQICHFFRADPAYGIGVATALGIDLDDFMPQGTDLAPQRTELAVVP